MKHLFLLMILLGSAASCQFFETEKISTETFYEEDLKTIDWKDVDQYPSFSDCSSITDKKLQKNCFETTLSNHLYQSISRRKIIASHTINDTVFLGFSISNKGELSVNNIKMDSLVRNEIPLLETWIFQSIDSLSPIAPAHKRGIPVKTEFTLPIIIKTQE